MSSERLLKFQNFQCVARKIASDIALGKVDMLRSDNFSNKLSQTPQALLTKYTNPNFLESPENPNCSEALLTHLIPEFPYPLPPPRTPELLKP